MRPTASQILNQRFQGNLLSLSARTRAPSALLRTSRARYASSTTAGAGPKQGSVWSAHAKKVGGTAMMYFPVVGVVMFWPLVTMPIMDFLET